MEIRDNGLGIPPDVRDRVFDLFFTTKPLGRGTGLGLPIAARIVEHHRGRLELRDSAAGAGATFRVVLPAA